MASPAVIFFSTFKNEESAHVFAHTAVRKKYAACINVLGPIKSIYLWGGRLHDETETLVMGKTTSLKFRQLKKRIKSLHSYDVPELIAVKVADGLPAYLKWIAKSVK